MRKTTRQILFFFFVGAFLVSAPLVVLYTAGYRLSLNNYRVLETGAIASDTFPHAAIIFVDGKKESNKTPAVIQNVMPHDTNIRFERSGYISWEQSIPVSAGKTTYVSATLFADAEPEEIIAFDPGSVTSTSSNGRYILVLEPSTSSVKVVLYDILTRFSRTLDTLPAETEPYTVSFNETDDHFLVQSATTPVAGYTTSGEKIKATDISSTNENIPIILIDNGKNVEVRLSRTETVLALLPQNNYNVIAADDEFIVLRDDRQLLTILSLSGDEPIALDLKATVFKWQPDLHLLAWSDGIEVDVYDAGLKTRTFLTRQSDLITTLAWHPSGSSLFIGTSSQVTAIDKEAFSNRVSTELLSSMTPLADMWLDKGAKNLYIVTVIDGAPTLERRKLVQ